MILRTLHSKLINAAEKFPIVAVLGPRQSGKSTLVRKTFPNYRYISLEDMDIRQMAEQDPRGFLNQTGGKVILDEVQRVPVLFSYLQGIVDEHQINGEFILTGSQNFLLMEKITQTLAGRICLNTLMPFSIFELKTANLLPQTPEQLIHQGGFPRLYAQQLTPEEWLPSYITTYLERDVYDLLKVRELSAFRTFLKACAGRVGQLVNFSSLGNDCGVSYNTVRSWISILEASYIVFLLHPHHQNFNKRLVKMPKLYFYDTGIVCSLLGINSPSKVLNSYLKGSLFENMIIADFYKQICNHQKQNRLYFWRDKTGHEIDLIYDKGEYLVPFEIKAGATFQEDFLKNMLYWNKISGQVRENHLITGGTNDMVYKQNNYIHSWQSIGDILENV
jgi:predicted AAA+ superfamily ATPase